MAILAGIAVPMILHKIKEGACAEACGNMRSVGCALLSFEADYGRFPCDATAPEVKDNNPDTPCILILGKTSANDYFRQLIAAGCMDTEIPFYARIAGCRKPDKRMDGTHTLEKGECGFSYIIGPDADCEPPQPLLVTPLIPGLIALIHNPSAGRRSSFGPTARPPSCPSTRTDTWCTREPTFWIPPIQSGMANHHALSGRSEDGE
jgi:hypothetical protein